MSNFPDFLKNEKNNEKILQKNEINSGKMKNNEKIKKIKNEKMFQKNEINS